MRIALVDDEPAARVADAAPAEAVTAAVESVTDIGQVTEDLIGPAFSGTLIVEGVWSGDGRMWAEGATTWRPLPLPFMGLTKTSGGHFDAELVGIITDITREGNEIRFGGSWLNTAEGIRHRELYEAGALRGVSGDWDDFDMELLIPAADMAPIEADEEGNLAEPPTETVDGEEVVVIPMSFPRERYTRVRAMGATILPFPAFVEAKMDDPVTLVASGLAAESGARFSGWLDSPDRDADEALVASLDTTLFPVEEMSYIAPPVKVRHQDGSPAGAVSLVARGGEVHPIQAPVCPPPEWMDYDPTVLGITAIAPTVTNEGRSYGYLAAWDSCHIGFPDECVTPPRSRTSYAHFMTGELVCADGSRVAVGQVTIGGPHADLHLGAAAAKAHYDDTCTAVMDVVVGEDDIGIWLAGALRPGLDPITTRAVLAADLSGDWRRIGGNLELVAALGVNVPGFHKRARTTMRTRVVDGQVASLVAAITPCPTDEFGRKRIDPASAVVRIAADALAESIGRHPRQLAEVLAASIGRTRRDRIEEMAREVRG